MIVLGMLIFYYDTNALDELDHGVVQSPVSPRSPASPRSILIYKVKNQRFYSISLFGCIL